MPDSPFDLIEGDIGTVMEITCLDENGAAIDITNATLIWYWQHEKRAVVSKESADGVVVHDGPAGKTRFTTRAGDVEWGDLRVQVDVDTPGGWHGSTDPVFYKVGRKLVKGL